MLRALVFAAVVVAAFPALVRTESEQDARARLESNGHLARYVLMATLEYSTESEALRVKEAIERGRLGLNDAMQKMAESKGKKKERSVTVTRNPGQGGRPDADESDGGDDSEELSADGLMTVDDVHPAVAELAFDVRNPTVSERSPNVLGPVNAGSQTHVLAVVFQRYRAGFFSPEWFEVEAYAKANGLSFRELLRDLEDEEASKYIAFQIWPDDDVPIKRLKLKTVKQNLARVGAGVSDPAAAQPVENTEPPREDVDEMLSQRVRFFDNVPDWVKEEHPEVWAMDIDDVIAAGLGPGAIRPSKEATPDDTGDVQEEATQPEGTDADDDHDEF